MNGYQLEYRWPEDGDEDAIPNSAGQPGDGLDVRGKGGYAALPGNVHVSGVRYEVQNDLDPAATPEELLSKIRAAVADR